MYRFNGVSMPGFSVGILAIVISAFATDGNFLKSLGIGVITWIIVDLVCFIEIVLSKRKPDSEKNQEDKGSEDCDRNA